MCVRVCVCVCACVCVYIHMCVWCVCVRAYMGVFMCVHGCVSPPHPPLSLLQPLLHVDGDTPRGAQTVLILDSGGGVPGHTDGGRH